MDPAMSIMAGLTPCPGHAVAGATIPRSDGFEPIVTDAAKPMNDCFCVNWTKPAELMSDDLEGSGRPPQAKETLSEGALDGIIMRRDAHLGRPAYSVRHATQSCGKQVNDYPHFRLHGFRAYWRGVAYFFENPGDRYVCDTTTDANDHGDDSGEAD